MTKARCFSVVFVVLGLMLPQTNASDSNRPFIFILGVAQDAGYPQANCYKDHCLPAWKNEQPKRSVVSLGVVDPQSKQKYLFEATPDLPQQLYELETVAPSNVYTLAGVFLTHAHIGHYSGLMYFGHESMGAKNIPVYAMPRMAKFLKNNGPWSQLVSFKNIQLMSLKAGQPKSFGQLQVTAFRVPHREEYSEAVGFHIQGPNKSALFIPDIDKWSEWDKDLVVQVKRVDYALVDATFYTDGELPGRDMSKVRHPFVTETMQRLDHLPLVERNKVWFIHLNHTNPLLNLNSTESQLVKEKGYNIAVEALSLEL